MTHAHEATCMSVQCVAIAVRIVTDNDSACV